MDRLNRPTVGRPIGRGAVRLVRLGTSRAVVVWRRGGETVVSLLLRSGWVTERLPAAVRPLEALDAEVYGPRPLLILGGGSRAVAVERRAGRWSVHPLPGGGARSGLRAALSTLSGTAVVAWTQGAPGGSQSIEAATFSLRTARWSVPRTAVPAGAVTAPVVDELVVEPRGFALLSAVTDPSSAGPGSAPAAALLRRGASAWTPLPPLPGSPASAPQLAFGAPGPGFGTSGLPIAAWLEPGAVRVAGLAAGGGGWEAPATAWSRPPDDSGSLYAVDDLAVDPDGRVVVVAAVDPGPGPDDHVFVVRRSGAATFAPPRVFASLYGSPRLVTGGPPFIAAFWVEDPSGSGLPEAALAP